MNNEKYFGNFGCREDVWKEFQEEEINFPCEGAIYVATYETESYDGFSFVLFENEGELFLVESSHCSCNGLENSWCPEPTTWKAIRMKQFYNYSDAFKSRIDALIAAHLPS